MGVEQLANEEYKFTIDLADGKGYQIQGEWSGPVELNYDPSTGLGKVEGAEAETVKFVGNSTLLVSGAAKGERLSVYTVGGQHVLSAVPHGDGRQLRTDHKANNDRSAEGRHKGRI